MSTGSYRGGGGEDIWKSGEGAPTENVSIAHTEYYFHLVFWGYIFGVGGSR
jgi:hypothetical protein